MENFEKEVFAVAYNILGTVEEAEDIVQEINIKLIEGKFSNAQNLKASVIRAAINQSINQKKKLRKIKYVGEWLPEPNFKSVDKSISIDLETSDLLSYELIHLMETLSSKERSVFVLRNAFDLEYQEIAEILELTLGNVRQIHSRTNRKLAETGTRKAQRNSSRQLEKSQEFVEYIKNGELKKLIKIFREDVGLYSDGGGVVHAIKKPIFGAERVAKFLLNVSKRVDEAATIQFGIVQKQPAFLVLVDNNCIACFIFSIRNHQISRIYSVMNPHKLSHLQKSLNK